MKASTVRTSPAGQPQHRWVLWLALWLAVFGATAPTLSRTLSWAHGDSANLIEICTSSGPRWMALGQVNSAALTPPVEHANGQVAADAAQGSLPTPAHVLDHCPFCLLLADRVAPPLAIVFLQMVLPGKPVAPTVSQVFFQPLFQAPTPPSRGPPTSLNF